MTQLPDLTIPLSALDFQDDARAHATAENWDTPQIGVLLQQVIAQHATGLLDEGALHTVSVTFDVSAEAATGSLVQFESRIDRKTRSLIFSSGLATQGGSVLLKATIVFRIA